MPLPIPIKSNLAENAFRANTCRSGKNAKTKLTLLSTKQVSPCINYILMVFLQANLFVRKEMIM